MCKEAGGLSPCSLMCHSEVASLFLKGRNAGSTPRCLLQASAIPSGPATPWSSLGTSSATARGGHQSWGWVHRGEAGNYADSLCARVSHFKCRHRERRKFVHFVQHFRKESQNTTSKGTLRALSDCKEVYKTPPLAVKVEEETRRLS